MDSTVQRWYAGGYGRFASADPYGGSANQAEPGSWNRYAYVEGDPINWTDRHGTNKEAEYSVTVDAQYLMVNPFLYWLMSTGYGGSSYESNAGGGGGGGGAEQRGGGGSGSTFKAAQKAFADGAGIIASKKSFRPPCNDDFAALGITSADVLAGASNVVFIDGIGSDVSRVSLYANSPIEGVRQAGNSVTGTVGQYFSNQPGVVAMADLGGNRVFLNSKLIDIDPAHYYSNISTVLHELLHNVTGYTDSDIQRKLGLPDSNVSNNISQRLLKDCF